MRSTFICNKCMTFRFQSGPILMYFLCKHSRHENLLLLLRRTSGTSKMSNLSPTKKNTHIQNSACVMKMKTKLNDVGVLLMGKTQHDVLEGP